MPKTKPVAPAAFVAPQQVFTIITEAELINFLADQELLRRTTESAKLLKASMDARERELMERLKAGAVTPKGFGVSIHVDERRVIPWKEVARYLWKEDGKDPDLMEARTKELTQPNLYPHLVVVGPAGGQIKKG